MRINKLRIINYKLFQDVIIEMNDNVNIFVGENGSVIRICRSDAYRHGSSDKESRKHFR